MKDRHDIFFYHRTECGNGFFTGHNVHYTPTDETILFQKPILWSIAFNQIVQIIAAMLLMETFLFIDFFIYSTITCHEKTYGGTSGAT